MRCGSKAGLGQLTLRTHLLLVVHCGRKSGRRAHRSTNVLVLAVPGAKQSHGALSLCTPPAYTMMMPDPKPFDALARVRKHVQALL